jgi:hypothetical protein
VFLLLDGYLKDHPDEAVIEILEKLVHDVFVIVINNFLANLDQFRVGPDKNLTINDVFNWLYLENLWSLALCLTFELLVARNEFVKESELRQIEELISNVSESVVAKVQDFESV